MAKKGPAKKRLPSRPRKGRVFVPKPAPGDLEMVQSFLNTRNRRSRIDRLTSVEELAAWLGRWSPVGAHEELTQADLDRARDLRKGLRALLLANSGFHFDAAAVERLGEVARGARLEVRVDPDGSTRFESVSPGFSGVVASLLSIVASARLSGQWSRFKACGYEHCRGIFYDFAPNRTGKWCTRQCGDLMRSRTHRLLHGNLPKGIIR